jgi:hypothetical protein
MTISFEEVLVGETFLSGSRKFIKIDDDTASPLGSQYCSPFTFYRDEDVEEFFQEEK